MTTEDLRVEMVCCEAERDRALDVVIKAKAKLRAKVVKLDKAQQAYMAALKREVGASK